jgi:hypothetical protein
VSCGVSGGPHIREIRIHIWKILGIVFLILAKKIGLVGQMKIIVPVPPWHEILRDRFFVGKWSHLLHSVLESP